MKLKRSITVLFLFVCLTSASLIAGSGISVDVQKRLLVAAAGTDYQWYRYGEVLSGENGQTVSVRESGTYTVVYTNNRRQCTRETVSIEVSGTKIVRVYLIGNSTVADYTQDADYMAKRYPITGWGQVFQAFMSSDSLNKVRNLIKADSVVVVDKARGGRSTRTFFE
jgi:major membrane immunogen (membrane-anchored lipoprotein)